MRTVSNISKAIKLLSREAINVSSLNSIQVSEEKILFGQDHEYQMKIADTNLLREQAYKLIYSIYLEKQFVKPHPSGMWFSKHDANNDTITIVVLKKERVVGALTIIINQHQNLPAYEIYHEEMDQLYAHDYKAVELVSLGVEKEARGSTEILTKLFNASYLISKYIYHLNDFIITVNPRHTFFYKRKLYFIENGGLKECNKVGGAPSKLLTLDLNHSERLIQDSRNGASREKSLYDGFLNEAESQIVTPMLKNYIDDSIKSKQGIIHLLMLRDDVATELLDIEIVI